MLLYLPSLSRRCRKVSHASSKQQVSTTGTDDSEVSCKQIRKDLVLARRHTHASIELPGP
jgi:hypothetical protein